MSLALFGTVIAVALLLFSAGIIVALYGCDWKYRTPFSTGSVLLSVPIIAMSIDRLWPSAQNDIVIYTLAALICGSMLTGLGIWLHDHLKALIQARRERKAAREQLHLNATAQVAREMQAAAPGSSEPQRAISEVIYVPDPVLAARFYEQVNRSGVYARAAGAGGDATAALDDRAEETVMTGLLHRTPPRVSTSWATRNGPSRHDGLWTDMPGRGAPVAASN